MSSNSPPRLQSLNVILLFLLACLLVWRYLPEFGNRNGPGLDPDAVPRPVDARGDLAEDEKSTIEIFKQASPSVVNVTSLAVVRKSRFTTDFMKMPKGSGSGFVWDEDGRIVTNYHVVKEALEIQVTLADHTTWKVTQARYDEDKDLAVLWTDAPKDKLRPLKLGESSTLQVGQKVFAIGNPFGLDQTLTTGIIRALGREFETSTHHTIKGALQTDAAINPGNSGGPLLDSAGRLIGVNTAIISNTGSSAGIGFAIPVDEVNRVVPRLIRGEETVRPGLGIQVANDQVLQNRGMRGVLIFNVQPDGPAAKAGLRPTVYDDRGNLRWGDIITAIDDHKINSTNQLFDLLDSQYKIGQEVTVFFRRGNQQQSVKVTLEADHF